MSDHSYVTPTRERPPARPFGAPAFPVIQGNRYSFLEVIGTGGGGTVFKAQDNVLNKPVAIKQLHACADGQAAVRFQREARLVAVLKHNNVMSALDFGLTPNNQPYLVLDFVDGESLSQLIRREGAMPLSKAPNIFIQLSRGLSPSYY